MDSLVFAALARTELSQAPAVLVHGFALHVLREMGGAPRNRAPRNDFLVWIVKTSGCHSTDGHLTSRVVTEDRKIS